MSINNNLNDKIHENTVYHTAVEDNENTSVFTDQNKMNMDDMFNTFVQIINSNNGKKFFESFVAGDISTWTKIANGMNTFSKNQLKPFGYNVDGNIKDVCTSYARQHLNHWSY